MDLTKILSISGKAGLFEVIGQTKNSGIIVESLIDGKRFPAYAAHKITSLNVSLLKQSMTICSLSISELFITA